ncbi:S-adenosyl-L-methionine-dependent methyltransferase [Trametopsis cervina]|nr:S-adenosyl-L-methionine-dependent methyltransferase [Trametopsis cervina]
MSTSPEISALLGLITTSATSIDAVYATSPAPLPSLDSTTPHPLDVRWDATLRENLRILQGACTQLIATLSPPVCTMVDRAQGVVCERACLDVVVSCKIPDILKAGPKEGIPVSEIARTAGIEQGKLERIMRYLATTHVFREVKQGVFANNRLSVQLLEENPAWACTKYSMSEKTRAGVALLPTLLDPVKGPSHEQNHAPWCTAHDWTRTPFDWYSETEEGRKAAEVFGRYMVAFGQAVGTAAVATEYPWHALPAGTTVCDVGSGIGAVTLELAKAHPGLKLILQDMPGVLQYAKDETWPKEAPEAIAEGRVEFLPMDFFKESPKEGCDFYFLKAILHDWNDERCTDILKLIRKVMKPTSRVLINEHLLRPATSSYDSNTTIASPTALKPAPAPLLSNAGRQRLYNLDITMLVLLNSKERFAHEYTQIGEKAGLKLEKIWETGDACVLEFAPV